jgi:hypothetical protein
MRFKYSSELFKKREPEMNIARENVDPDLATNKETQHIRVEGKLKRLVEFLF